MGDLKSKHLIYLKGLLFTLLGMMAVGLILVEHPDLRLTILLGIAVWSFCRAYYCAFYVIEHYVDPNFRFAGLGSFISYLWRQQFESKRSH